MFRLFHTHRFLTIKLLCLALACFPVLLGSGPAAAQDGYRVSSGDSLSFRFAYWNTIDQRFVELDAVNGVYQVGPEGAVMLPVIGVVEVAGTTLPGIIDRTSVLLQNRLALVEPPSGSVSVVEYGPVYVLGAVARPGAYEYAPGLTVQKALALAGGLDTTAEDGPDTESATIRVSGRLEQIGIEIAREEIRTVRLRAEMEAAPDLVLPDGTDEQSTIAERERMLFRSRRLSLQRALAALDDSRTLLETEIAALSEKLARQVKQVNVLREAVGNMEALFERGLVRSPNLVSLQGQLISLENNQLDTETAIFRARQTLTELERERLEIESDRQLAVLGELQRSEARIDQLKVERSTNLRLLLSAGTVRAGEEQGLDMEIGYEVTRETGERPETRAATLATRLAPSDVVTIWVRLDPGTE